MRIGAVTTRFAKFPGVHSSDPFLALQQIHDELWDELRGLMLMPAGASPGFDISGFGLHTVRESALGALLDLTAGRTDRAETALRNVIALQYQAPGRAWDGTFPVTAEQADPPDDAVEWFHYDPNWRQFLGTIMLIILLDHAGSLPGDLVEQLWTAVVRCADSEPVDRIPEWYTNPNLLHAWVQAHAGRHLGDAATIDAGSARARRTMDRLSATGDVDEYNSPTYDGVDLMAAALWSAFPPAPEFEQWGAELARTMCGRLSTLIDPDSGVVCGPYARAYGLGLDRYVSLLGLWLSVAGVDAALPADLRASTDHSHDLFFLPVVKRLAGLVSLPWNLRPVAEHRRHVQTVGEVTAVSSLQPGLAVGWASGLVPPFASDQYVPFTIHYTDAAGRTAYVGARPSFGCGRFDVTEAGPDRWEVLVKQSGADLRWTCSAEPTVADGVLTFGLVQIMWSGHNSQHVARNDSGEVDLLVHGSDVRYNVVVLSQ